MLRFLCVLLLGIPASVLAALIPTALRCEFSADPLGIDVARPRLSWQLTSELRGDAQTAYEILVASSAELLARDTGDLWHSGRIKSDESLHHAYAGKPLRSSQEVFWKVRVWDAQRKISAWSPPARWTMGVVKTADWNGAKWIGESVTNAATTLLRREFTIRPGLKRAILHVSGLGQFRLTANSRETTTDVLSPGWTAYQQTCLYETRDLTALLDEGTNVLGLELANGMYSVPGGRYVKFKGSFGPRRAIALLRLEYHDGSHEELVTDERWRMAAGPITFSCVYGGEDFDARQVPEGWDASGFDATTWHAPGLSDGPGGILRGHSAAAPPLRAFEIYPPRSVTTLTNGALVYDFGQNAPFLAKLRVKGPSGAMVRITPAELLKPDGTIDRGSVGGGRAYWQYTLRGGTNDPRTEEYLARFFYHGARYFQVELRPATNGTALPEIESLEGVVMHSSSESIGAFACSNDLFNRIHTLVRWAQRANLVSVLTDCPHREKLGWLEQYHLNGPSLRYEFDLARLFTKGMNDMADAQLATGLVPNIAPEYVVFGPAAWDKTGAFRDSPEWGSAFLLVPWQQYLFTGDTELLRRHYDAMKRYVAYLGSRATNHIVNHGLGDWYDIGPKPPGFAQLTPKSLTATAFYQHDVWILSQAAAVLGKNAERRDFAKGAEQIRQAFNREFFDATNQTYATGSQCANALPLVMNLCEPQHRAAVLAALVADVERRGLTAGDVGYRYLLRALADGGRSDVVFAMNNQSVRPGYGYQLQQGATSLTEAWDARRSSSQNHFMLGQIIEWFYADLAGIAPDPAAPGFRHVIINPQPVGDITWARASYDSVRGPIECNWLRDGTNFLLRVTLPPGTEAQINLPARAPFAPAGDAVKFIRHANDRSLLRVGSGKYEFRSAY